VSPFVREFSILPNSSSIKRNNFSPVLKISAGILKTAAQAPASSVSSNPIVYRESVLGATVSPLTVATLVEES
jgi:hypothetical protein